MIEYETLQKSNQEFEAEFRESFEEFLGSGWYILGNSVQAFEKEFAEYCGADHCIGVANGLEAIEIGIKCLDLPLGSEIIVPANTYIATILGIINSGHMPVLVEPNLKTYNLDADLVKAKITTKTKAIMVVHLYGQAAEMDKLTDIANEYGLEIIEDCAQAHGANFKGTVVGNFGKVGAYSFYPTKNLGAMGDAGAILTNDSSLAEKLRAYRNYGSKVKYVNEYLGVNSRLDEIQAAFLRIKLKKLNILTQKKRQLAAIYDDCILAPVVKPAVLDGSTHVYHIYNIRTDQRDELKEFLLQKGIKTEIHYPIPPHQQQALANYFQEDSYPVTEEIHRTTLSLPISYGTTEDEARIVSNKINEFFE